MLRPVVLGLVAILLAEVVAIRAWDTWLAGAAERQVVALDGIGASWADTLRRIVVVPVAIDTLTGPILDYYAGGNLLGLHELWYDRVRINTDLASYIRFSRNVSAQNSFGYQHPAWLAYPAAVIAHEFGHRYQAALPDDSRWKYADPERFADAFAYAMLQIRGWLPVDLNGDPSRLRHELKLQLFRSYWNE